MKLILHVVLLQSEGTLPTKAHDTDAGWDLYAAADYNLEGPSNRISTSIALGIPKGHFGLIRDRSGNAAKGLRVSAGVIDSGYTGEVLVLIDNVGPRPYHVKRGDRIAQLLILPVPDVEVLQVSSLDASARNDKGFASSGR